MAPQSRPFPENAILSFFSVKSPQHLRSEFFWGAYFLVEGIRNSSIAERFFQLGLIFSNMPPKFGCYLENVNLSFFSVKSPQHLRSEFFWCAYFLVE